MDVYKNNRSMVEREQSQEKPTNNKKRIVSVVCRLFYYNITRLTKINFCIAFAICSLLNANNSRSLKFGVKKSLQANFFTYIIKKFFQCAKFLRIGGLHLRHKDAGR